MILLNLSSKQKKKKIIKSREHQHDDIEIGRAFKSQSFDKDINWLGCGIEKKEQILPLIVKHTHAHTQKHPKGKQSKWRDTNTNTKTALHNSIKET